MILGSVLFQLNFGSDRYLPFHDSPSNAVWGTFCFSLQACWRLESPSDEQHPPKWGTSTLTTWKTGKDNLSQIHLVDRHRRALALSAL